jgi:DNA polymerase III delta prime subunit
MTQVPDLPPWKRPQVFISYRREHGSDTARAIQGELEMAGIETFLDVDDLGSNPFDETILRQIEAAPHFLIILSPGCLDRVQNPADWLRREVAHAIKTQRNIIPVRKEGFQVPKQESLPADIAALARYHCVEYSHHYYSTMIERIRERIEEKPANQIAPARAASARPGMFRQRRTAAPSESGPEQRNRERLLRRVHNDWIDGVLDRSLYKLARIELGLETNIEAIEHPLNAVVQVPDQPPRSLPHGTQVADVFREHGESLLILGDPGTGKTTLLLELLRHLLTQAARDADQPIPVVFNLSPWARKRRPIEEWLIEELRDRDYLPKHLARKWITGEQISPLLDGLDEVAAEHRKACVQAINRFRSTHPLLPIAVSCRTQDYEEVGRKVRLLSAISVRPLTDAQVCSYLEEIGSHSFALRTILGSHAGLAELLHTPLMLSVALMVYRDGPVTPPTNGTREQWQVQLFSSFVDVMLSRRAPRREYSADYVKQRLSWLALTLRSNNLTIFDLESLAPSFLSNRNLCRLSTGAVFLATSVTVGVASGLAIWFTAQFYVLEAVTLGLLAGVLTVATEIRPAERLRFYPKRTLERAGSALRFGLTVGLISTITVGGGFGLLVAMLHGFRQGINAAREIGLYLGGLFGISAGLSRLLLVETTGVRTCANEGTRRSIKAALTLMVLVGVVGMFLSKSVIHDQSLTTYQRIWYVVAGVINIIGSVGLIVGGLGGGFFALRHFVVRGILWALGKAPLNYVAFLDYASDRLLLRKVGGGYVFMHRMLLEHLAQRSDR